MTNPVISNEVFKSACATTGELVELVTITHEEYKSLLEDSRKLSLLYDLDLPFDLDEMLLLNEEENNV